MKNVIKVYVDESIHVRGDFIVTAAVCSHINVQQQVVQALLDCGFDPTHDEFKSSMRMDGNPAAQELRQRLQIILRDCKIGVTVCPTSERAKIATYIAALLSNLNVQPGTNIAAVYLDEGIKRTNAKMPVSATVRYGCNSKLVTGIQLADCAAHLISTMLLDELGFISKTVAARTVYEGQEGEIALAWTLWATVRYSLSGMKLVGERDEYGVPEPLMNPFGLVVSDTCSDDVKAAVENRLSTVWLGCIH
ncbi:hypothetical protein [Roseibium aggregatum]|uniref:hypothetical protein n=1 Tax=Roseibium aggregatum TaxID=187304 RepID=UPI00094AEA85|nr:hypothetical protein [Roseibium aggregatum]UFI04134.1 hypothetical protein ST40_003080 [Roseibium aggregatum]